MKSIPMQILFLTEAKFPVIQEYPNRIVRIVRGSVLGNNMVRKTERIRLVHESYTQSAVIWRNFEWRTVLRAQAIMLEANDAENRWVKSVQVESSLEKCNCNGCTVLYFTQAQGIYRNSWASKHDESGV